MRLAQDSLLSLPTYQGTSTPPPELNVVDVKQVEKVLSWFLAYFSSEGEY
jgi:hypothetical protein